MSKPSIDHLLRFEQLLQQFALVERIAHITGRESNENDAEHSYFIPMLAWFIIDTYALPLNRDLVLRYALVHDLVEVYAGDTYIFDTEALKTKHEREEKARLQIAAEFPDFNDLNATIEAYEKQADAESRFVKAVDKLEPVLANYLQEGRTWKEMHASFEEITKQKREKVQAVSEVAALLEEMIVRIEARKDELFLR